MGFTTQLEEAKQTGRVKKVTTQGTVTVTGSLMSKSVNKKYYRSFFIKKSIYPRDSDSANLAKDNEAESTCKLRASEQKSSTSSQPTNHVWPVKDSATKAEIIATLQFAFQNIPFSCAENLAACYQPLFSDSSIAKNVLLGLQRCHI